MYIVIFFFFFFNDTATTEIYTLSLHDALPIFTTLLLIAHEIEHHIGFVITYGDSYVALMDDTQRHGSVGRADRKSTRLNSSHANISYAVFCLKKKKKLNICTY